MRGESVRNRLLSLQSLRPATFIKIGDGNRDVRGPRHFAQFSKKLRIRENKNGRIKTEVYDPPIIDVARGFGRAVDAQQVECPFDRMMARKIGKVGS